MNPNQLSSVLSRLAALAALAPSSHNCQPWRVLGLGRAEFEAEMWAGSPAPAWSHALLICIDRRRALSALPSLEREMRMSVGGFASLLLNLLRLSGFGVEARFLDAQRQPGTAAGRARLGASEPVLVLYLREPAAGVQALDHPLVEWISQRHTMRGPYKRQGALPPPGACLPFRLADDNDLVWKHVAPGELFDRLCEFYRRHAEQDFRHGGAWRETYGYLEFSAKPRVGSGAGINIQSLFGPLSAWRRRLYQALLHPAVIPVTGPLGLYARFGRDFEQLVRSSGHFVYLSAAPGKVDERRMHLLAGERVCDLWLSATRDGQALHPLSVALQHTAIEAKLRALLDCPQPILFIARSGAPVGQDGPVFRYRREPQAFCSFNFKPSSAA